MRSYCHLVMKAILAIVERTLSLFTLGNSGGGRKHGRVRLPHLFPAEALERRYALAVTTSFTDGRLDILGGAANNTILVSTTNLGGIAKVTVNGLQVGSGVDASAVTSIAANLGGGAAR